MKVDINLFELNNPLVKNSNDFKGILSNSKI